MTLSLAVYNYPETLNVRTTMLNDVLKDVVSLGGEIPRCSMTWSVWMVISHSHFPFSVSTTLSGTCSLTRMRQIILLRKFPVDYSGHAIMAVLVFCLCKLATFTDDMADRLVFFPPTHSAHLLACQF